MKRAVIFGGAGFIGCHLATLLMESGDYSDVVSCDIQRPRWEVPGVHQLHIDVREPISLPIDWVPDEIFNLAAVHITPGHPDWEYYWTNVMGATNVCRYARKVGCPTIVFTSSISIYGPTERELDENSVPNPETAYGRSKLAAEKIHEDWQGEEPETRRLVVVRPAVIYGVAERGNFTRMGKLISQGTFMFPGRSDTIKSCGYVRDLVRSMLFMRDRNPGVVTYNFAHPARYTARDIADTMAETGKYKRPTLIMPLAVMNGIGLAFEILASAGVRTSINRARVSKLNRSTNVLPGVLMREKFDYRYDLRASLADWRATSPSGRFE